MIRVSVTTTNQAKSVTDAVERKAFRNVNHAAASIRKEAAASITNADGPSPEGSAPHSKAGQLRRAIRYAGDKAKLEAVVGPRASMVGDAGAAHEFGEEFRGTDYPERPFMGPALESNLDRFASSFAGSLS